MYFGLMSFAIVMAIAEIYAAKKNFAFNSQMKAKSIWHLFYRFRLFIGIFFSFGSYFFSYPYESNKIMGFPIMTAIFEADGSDYVGSFTIPSIIVNAVLWFFIPSLLLFIWSKLIRSSGI